MDSQHTACNDQKRPYEAPKVELQGKVEDLTQWVGGRWGEFFSGPISGWNVWANSGCGS